MPEHEVETQTDEFLDRPASPMFIPIKTGVDKETQILEGDLFDFELEVSSENCAQRHCATAAQWAARPRERVAGWERSCIDMLHARVGSRRHSAMVLARLLTCFPRYRWSRS